jgi:very-short-patch-repair endonuclease
MVLPQLAELDLPAPRCNAPVELAEDRRVEVDFLWAEQYFVLEADSRDFHATEVAFERDRWRDRELMRVGYGSLRVTRRQAEREPAQVAEAVVQELARRLA